jgi:hypothetical protein
MRRILLVLAVLSLAFAPAPFPKPDRGRMQVTTISLRLKKLDAVELAAALQKGLGPAAVTVNARTNELRLHGPAARIAALAEYIRMLDDKDSRRRR